MFYEGYVDFRSWVCYQKIPTFWKPKFELFIFYKLVGLNKMCLMCYREILWNESSITRRERLRMICKIQVGHKIHVRIDWWTFFFHPTPPWRRNGGSKICLECKITCFFPKSDGLDRGDRGHLVASTSILAYLIHVGVDWWTYFFYPRPPSAPNVDQKLAYNTEKTRHLTFFDSKPIFDPLSELKEVSDKHFKFTNRLRHECGIPGWM